MSSFGRKVVDPMSNSACRSCCLAYCVPFVQLRQSCRFSSIALRVAFHNCNLQSFAVIIFFVLFVLGSTTIAAPDDNLKTQACVVFYSRLITMLKTDLY